MTVVIVTMTNGIVGDRTGDPVETRRTKARQVTLTLLAVSVIGGLYPGAAVATAGDKTQRAKGHRTTFEGSCSLEGTVIFEPGATFVAQPLGYDFTGEGKCSGKLNGKEISDTEVAVHQYGDAEGSCAQAQTTRPGIGEMTFPDGELLSYSLEFSYVFQKTNFVWHGSQSGTAGGTGTFRTDRTPPDTTARCATPTGATEVPMDITMQTETVMVSSAKR